MSLDILPLLLATGILLGTFYALMASGFGLIWGVMKVVNVAHAGVIMLGAYFAQVMLTRFGVDPLVSFVMALALFFPFGVATQRLLVVPVLKAPPLTSLLLLYGLWLIMQNLAFVAFSANFQFIGGQLAYSRIIYYGFPLTRILASILSVIVVAALYIFLTHTKIGLAIRASSQDSEMSMLVGVNVKRVQAFAFGLGTALAAMSGSMASMLYAFDPNFGGTLLTKAFAIIVLGGMESVLGIALAGLVIGLAEAIGGFYLPFGLVDAVSFAIFLIVLIIRPTGFFGKFRV